MGLMATEQEALKTRAAALVLRDKERQQRAKDLAQKQKHRRLLRLEMMNILESFPFLVLVFFLALMLGTAIGINIPDGVGCDPQNSLCQRFRFRQPIVPF